MLVTEVIDLDKVQGEIKNGYVIERSHPEFPELRILNYADKCQFEQRWNNETRNCRGLIYNADTLELVARGMPKWFNYGHDGFAPSLSPDDYVDAYVKWDGSLGILYQRPDGKWAIATRGSFTSEQSIHANERLKDDDYLAGYLEPVGEDVTTVVEIIYPENRIVVNYNDLDELVLLGDVSNRTGEYHPSGNNRVHSGALRDVLAMKFDGDEGYILRTEVGEVVKYKHAEYLELHRIVSHLTEKEVWRQLMAGTFEEFATNLPDEFHQWANDVAARLNEEFNEVQSGAWSAHAQPELQELETRKEQALWINANVAPDYRGMVFSLLDGRDISNAIWKKIEPKGAPSA